MGSLKSAAIFDHFHTSFAWNSLHTNSLKFILKSALSYLYTLYILEPIWCKYSIGISLRIFWISVFEHVSWTTKSICIVSRPMFCVNCVISLHASRLFFFQLFAHFSWDSKKDETTQATEKTNETTQATEKTTETTQTTDREKRKIAKTHM